MAEILTFNKYELHELCLKNNNISCCYLVTNDVVDLFKLIRSIYVQLNTVLFNLIQFSLKQFYQFYTVQLKTV